MGRRPVVVGVDGSPESGRAVELAWKIAQAAHAELVPVYAVPDLWLAGDLEHAPELAPQVREALIHDSRAGIERFLQGLLPSPARKRLEVRTGPAAIAIAEAAQQRRAELVVLGGRHHGALARGAGRSTAHYLVRKLDVPLLVVGPSPVPAAHVLAAVDLSPASIPTLKAAERFAHLLGARLRVIHVVQPLRFMFLIVDMLDQRGFEERSRVAFDRLVAPLTKVRPEDRVLRTGPVAETVTTEATSWPADLIVVGSHGKGWADRLLVGSTTERLLNALPVSLLVIPTAARREPRQRPVPRRSKAMRKRRPKAASARIL